MNKEKLKTYSNVWISSDLHLNHRNILKYCPHRNLKGIDVDTAPPEVLANAVTLMNETIISNLNSKIGPSDLHIIVGDVCMGQSEKMLPLIERLNGDILLIAGNHDRSLRKLLREGHPKFVGVYDMFTISPRKNLNLVFCHFPIASWDGMSHGVGSVMLHGHLHGARCTIENYDKLKIMDVGIDTNNLFPYSLDDIERIMSTRSKPKADHHGVDLAS